MLHCIVLEAYKVTRTAEQKRSLRELGKREARFSDGVDDDFGVTGVTQLANSRAVFFSNHIAHYEKPWKLLKSFLWPSVDINLLSCVEAFLGHFSRY